MFLNLYMILLMENSSLRQTTYSYDASRFVLLWLWWMLKPFSVIDFKVENMKWTLQKKHESFLFVHNFLSHELVCRQCKTITCNIYWYSSHRVLYIYCIFRQTEDRVFTKWMKLFFMLTIWWMKLSLPPVLKWWVNFSYQLLFSRLMSLNMYTCCKSLLKL